ncbi:MAG: hypothetical protein H6529_14485 [Nocardioides sp.]|nr:hypothetical protein [Nocardioides sp.]
MTTVQERRESEQPRRPIDLPRYEPGHALHSHHPADLIVRRPELYGVSKLADVTADSVLWSA